MIQRAIILISILTMLSGCASTTLDVIPPDGTGADTIQYYRLRFIATCTSDWASIEINGLDFLTWRGIERNPSPETCDFGENTLYLEQPIEDADADMPVSTELLCAITPEDIVKPFMVTIMKGDLNEVHLSIEVEDMEGVTQAVQITHDTVMPGSGGLNTRMFPSDLIETVLQAPFEYEIPEPEDKMLWAFYYPWYTTESWDSEILVDRPLTPYSSDMRLDVARQIDEAEIAGIDGFISSWWGPGSYTDLNLGLVLEEAEKENFKVCIYFETLGDGNEPQSESTIETWLEYVIDTYSAHPAYMKVNGKPLIVVWSSGAVPLETWQAIFWRLRNKGVEAFYVGYGYDVENLTVFDAYHEYGIFTYDDLDQVYFDASRTARYYPMVSATGQHVPWIATVQPGYDDRLIPGRDGIVVERDFTNYYRYTWDTARLSKPDWIFITSWSEWWENTHIEPSELYCTQYMTLTGEYALVWK